MPVLMLEREPLCRLKDPVSPHPIWMLPASGGGATGRQQTREGLDYCKRPVWRQAVSSLLLLLSRFSRVRLLATPWTAAPQAPPSMGFSRQDYWSGVPLPSPKERANHSNILAWEIPWTEEPGGLQSMESQGESDTT